MISHTNSRPNVHNRRPFLVVSRVTFFFITEVFMGFPPRPEEHSCFCTSLLGRPCPNAYGEALVGSAVKEVNYKSCIIITSSGFALFEYWALGVYMETPLHSTWSHTRHIAWFILSLTSLSLLSRIWTSYEDCERSRPSAMMIPFLIKAPLLCKLQILLGSPD